MFRFIGPPKRTLQPVVGGLWTPYIADVSLGNNIYIIDLAGEVAVLVFRCPRDGVLDRFDFNLDTVTNSPDNGLRASFQGVSATTGLQDGVILGGTNNAFVTYAHVVAAGWKSTNFGETVTVTRGQLIAGVIDIPTFTASDSVAIGHVGLISSVFPYGISATSTKSAQRYPIIVPHYTDGYAFISPNMPAVLSTPSVGFHVNTATADEYGTTFKFPFPFRLNAVAFLMTTAAGADFETVVYDQNGTTVLSSVAYDGDVAVASIGFFHAHMQTELILNANTIYRATVRPTTATGVTFLHRSFNSADLMATSEGGLDFYMTTRLDQGATWTNWNAASPGFKKLPIMFNIAAL